MRIVFITGASSGIGKAIAEEAITRGYHPVVTVRSDTDFASWDKTKVTPLKLDVANEDSIRTAVTSITDLLNSATRVDLVNNAGIVVSGPIEATPLKKWREQFEVNVFGLIHVTQTLLPWIRKTKGTVVNIGSISGLVAMPYLGPYCASKYAVEAISDSLRRELGPFGVKVSLVQPGPIETPIWNKGISKKDEAIASIPEHLREIYTHPLQRFVKEVEKSARSAVPARKVGALVLKILAAKRPAARYVVGQALLPAQMHALRLVPDKLLDLAMGAGLRD